LFSLVTCVPLFEFPATHQFPWSLIYSTAVQHFLHHHVYLSFSHSLSVGPVLFVVTSVICLLDYYKILHLNLTFIVVSLPGTLLLRNVTYFLKAIP